MNQSRTLYQLVQRYMEGTISCDEMATLNSRLRENERELDEFIETLNLDSAIAEVLAEEVSIQKTIQTPHRVRSRSTVGRTMVSGVPWVIATLLLVAIGGVYAFRTQPAAFAIISISTAGDEFPEGMPVHKNWIHISAGAMEIVTTTGARVAVEAPAELRLESPQKLHLKSGRLAAEIPPSAKGFTVVTPSGKAVDLGTTFGVDVANDKETEIHVFKGEVIAETGEDNKSQSLLNGDALKINGAGGVSRDLRSAAFIRPSEVEPMRAALAFGRKRHADLLSRTLRDDPDLISLFDFESDVRYEGVYRVVQGRWPGSHAPEFKSQGDHIKLKVEEDREFPQLTMAAWIRLDELRNPYQSLLHTDNWFQEGVSGQIHWMVTDAKTMRLAILNNQTSSEETGQRCDADSKRPVFSSQQRWIHLAVTYDSEARVARFYLNGEFDNAVHFDVAHPARLGPSQMGNWNAADRKLSGRIDELVLLSRAASDEEIRAFYDAGNPYAY
ncbi:LamG-like jellyroll fold domain-containing protein [Planctomicrobium sp. SH661]|uniref:LamG-like jellyroll fold domain-containing protein n=1 Tax=Planctomicrobium sp. SH661 TaxID=3448124 RepID=UPI003F5B56F5